MTENIAANRETMGFQTEVKQLLQLMIHSLYFQPRNIPARTGLQRI